MGFRETGIITLEDLERLGAIPPEERLRRGPVVIPECPENIPCNICVSACPFNAIRMETINDRPRVDWDRCTGCGVCVSACPGQALFVVDLSKEDYALVTLPYEFLPPPRRGGRAVLLGRDGSRLGVGEIVRAWERNRTWVVTVKVPRDKAFEVRAIWVEE